MGDSAEKIRYPNFSVPSDDPNDTVSFEFEKGASVETATVVEQPVDPGVQITPQLDLNRNWELPLNLPTLTRHEPLVKKRNSIAKRAVLLTSGLAIGVCLAVNVLQDNSSPSRQAASSFSAESANLSSADEITVTASDSTSKDLIGDKEYAKSLARQQSGAAEYAISQPFNIAVRNYLYLKNSGRYFGTEFNATPLGETSQSLKVSAPSLTKVPGDEGRFQPQSGNLQWQGGFRIEDPEHNIQLGAAYEDYLKKSLGSGDFESLSSFQTESTDLLPQIKRGPIGLGLRKHK